MRATKAPNSQIVSQKQSIADTKKKYEDEFRSLSVKKKLWLLSVLSTSVAAVVSILLIMAMTWNKSFEDEASSYLLKGKMVADTIAPAIIFNDPNTAQEILHSFTNDQNVLRSEIQLLNKEVFGTYNKKNAVGKPIFIEDYDTRTINVPILQKKDTVGILLLTYDTSVIYNKIYTNLSAVALSMLFALGVGLYFAKKLHRMIHNPLAEISTVMREISESMDYSKRAPTNLSPEISEISRSFNSMIQQIETRERQLELELSERRRVEKQLEHIAMHDTLTQLPNRNNLFIRLDQVLASAKRNKTKVAIFFIDLDRFKSINDTLGHNVGDIVLKETGSRLNSVVRASDILARIGGDEFVIVQQSSSIETASIVASKIIDCLDQDFIYADKNLKVTSSIGISFFPDDSESIEDLMKHSDMAMYHAKVCGKNNFKFFTSDLKDGMSKKLDLEMQLRNAIENNEMYMVYQPKFGFSGNNLVSFESLIRWKHPTEGNIPPGVFIPIAEESGQIVKIGEWIIQQVIRQAHLWEKEFGKKITVAINISSKQLKDNQLERVVNEAIASNSSARNCIELEITESVFMENPEGISTTLKRFQDQGIKISIDDFGTGYSSLSYLKKLPLNYLKLDQSFVRDIERDQNDAAICHATISLAHSLGLEVIAEGIESLEQYDYLNKLGCDIGQGYYYSKPVEPHECARWLAAV